MPNAPKPKLTLYGHPHSRASIAHYMLEELGEPYDYRVLDLQKNEHKQPAYLAVNPAGKVPALDDGGVIITEVSAICCYLADAYPTAGLAPPIGDPLRGPYLKWLFYAPSCVEPAMCEKIFGWQVPRRSAVGWSDLDTVVNVLAAALTEGPYLFGEKFTAADVVIGSGLSWGMMFKGIPEREQFTTYVDRLKQRPAWLRKTAREEDILRAAAS